MLRTRDLVLLLLTLLLVIPSVAVAEEDSGGNASLGFYNRNVWRGITLSDSTVVQGNAGVEHGALSVDLWFNYDQDTSEMNETDWALAYGWGSDTVSWEAGTIYYAFDGVADTQEIYLGAGFDTALSPSVTLYWDIDEGSGGFLQVGIGHTLEFGDERGLDLGTSVSYNLDNEVMGLDGAGEAFSGLYHGEVSAAMSFPLGEVYSLDVMATYTLSLSDDAETAISAMALDGGDSAFYGGISFSFSF
jgi:hypothetical protein